MKIKTKGLVFDAYYGGLYPVFAIKDGYYSSNKFHEGNGYTLTVFLKADDVNFGHDICGIHTHLNHETKKLEHWFLPRFAR